MGANLYGAEGVWVGRLGGTNLFDAILPETIAAFDSTKAIADATKVARWFYFLILAASLACISLIGLTTDVRLIVDASAIPVARFPRILSMTSCICGFISCCCDFGEACPDCPRFSRTGKRWKKTVRGI
jgi:hypothetical protein